MKSKNQIRIQMFHKNGKLFWIANARWCLEIIKFRRKWQSVLHNLLCGVKLNVKQVLYTEKQSIIHNVLHYRKIIILSAISSVHFNTFFLLIFSGKHSKSGKTNRPTCITSTTRIIYIVNYNLMYSDIFSTFSYQKFLLFVPFFFPRLFFHVWPLEKFMNTNTYKFIFHASLRKGLFNFVAVEEKALGSADVLF